MSRSRSGGPAAYPISIRSLPGEHAVVQLVGVRLHARTVELLEDSIENLSDRIFRIAEQHPSADRRFIERQVTHGLNPRPPSRVFGAVLGQMLRLGRLDVLPCAATSGKVFRVLVAGDAWTAFHDRVRETGLRVRSEGRILIRDVQDKYWGRGYCTWSYASHLCARVVLLGLADYVDKWSVEYPRALRDAIS